MKTLDTYKRVLAHIYILLGQNVDLTKYVSIIKLHVSSETIRLTVGERLRSLERNGSKP